MADQENLSNNRILKDAANNKFKSHMIYFKSIASFVFLLLVPFILTAQPDISQLERQADSLYQQYEEEQALELYHQVLQDDPNHYKALWRTSFLYSRIGNRMENEDEQEEYYNRGIDFAERALEVDSTDVQSNFVMSVAMGRKALISGARERVSASRDIKKYVDRALEYDSTHAGAWHVLGRWNFKIANLSWIERTAANTLFGGIPGDASNEKAAQNIEKAIELNDQYVLYYYDLATVYEEMGRDQEAIETCQRALELSNLTPDDEQVKEDCRELIDDLQ